jgi:hypothetical protein
MILLVLAFPSPSPAQIDLETSRIYDPGLPPNDNTARDQILRDLRVADFDEDGDPDIAVVWTTDTGGQGQVVFLQNLAPGILAPGPSVVSLGIPGPLAIDDFDGDGHLDLAVGIEIEGKSTILVHYGDGSFGFPAIVLGFGEERARRALASGDFDGDGRIDLLAGNDDGSLSFLPGLPDRHFGVETSVAGAGDINSIDTGDLDGNGTFDAVVARGNQTFTILLGGVARAGGGFPFGSVTTVSTGNPGRSIVVADVTLDGHLDLVLANPATDTVTIHEGDGQGSFPTSFSLPTGDGPKSVVVADLDRDGVLDLATSDQEGSSITRIRGTGDGGFETAETVFLGTPLRKIQTGDFDADGVLDFAGVLDVEVRFQADEEFVHVLPGSVVETVQQPRRIDVGSGFGRKDIKSGDFDEDGHLDIVIEDSNSELGFFRGDGAGGFVPGPGVPTPFVYPRSFEVLDLDGDGHLDVVSVSHTDPGIGISLGDGSGGFPNTTFLPTRFDAGYLDFGDLDEDGFLDIAVGWDESVRSQDLFSWFLADGNGGFGPERVGIGPLTLRPSGIALGDFDEDGHLDALTVQNVSGVPDAYLFLGDGQGNLLLQGDFLVPQSTRDYQVRDIDEDGHLDLVRNANQVERVAWHLGDGQGNFSPEVALSLTADEYTFVDLDGDGILDLIGVQRETEACFVAPGLGQGAFDAPIYFSGAADPAHLAPGDFDEDGQVDIVVMGDTPRELTVIRNRSRDHLLCRRGNVNAAAGPVADVLFGNGTSGNGDEREVRLSPTDPFQLTIDSPPARAGRRTRYVIYGSLSCPGSFQVEALPFGLGRICIDSPLTGGTSDMIFNTVGRVNIVGEATMVTQRAPAVLVDAPGGLLVPGVHFFQGVILDPGSIEGRAAVTNAIKVIVE